MAPARARHLCLVRSFPAASYPDFIPCASCILTNHAASRRHTFSLSLTLAFLNSLPLPRLDGLATLAALRLALAAPSSFPDAGALEAAASVGSDGGILGWVLAAVRGWGAVRAWVGVGEEGERVLRRWTMGVVGVLVACTGVASLAGRG